tara:strand:+ start:1461 stop:2462 length:1002 start_codon:yes stop_codon:yes gene_type:complete
MDKILVMGCGTWGSVIAQSLAKNGYNVTMWHYNEKKLTEFQSTRLHSNLLNFSYHPTISFNYNLNDIVAESSIIVIATPSNTVRDIIIKIKSNLNDNHIIVNTSKGLELDTLYTMSEVISSELNNEFKNIVSLYGPSHAEEVVTNQPATLVSASLDIDTAKIIQRVFSSQYLRVYANQDIKGVELGGSLKNIIAIATGICDGLGFGDNTKAAIITRGIAEITRLGVKMGALSSTFSGLSGIGDLIATCLSKHSRNRYVGESIGSGKSLNQILETMEMVAEGIITAKSVNQLSQKYEVEMPISKAVFQILFEELDPKKVVLDLMSRDLTTEKNN